MVGVVGCGSISGAYLRTLQGRVAAVFDLDAGKAADAAAVSGAVAAPSLEALLGHPGVSVVLNLTHPAAHAGVTAAALGAGKHVYSEKPLASSLAEAAGLCGLAAQSGLALGCAPDTVLGTGLQSARAALDAGMVGEVVAGQAFMLCPGHEAWHPDPEFYYKPGGGPLWDMGPYYLTALVWLLGPVAAVTAASATPTPVRTVGSGPRRGERIEVGTPTTLGLLLEFASGALVQFSASFDVRAHGLPHIELYGRGGTLRLPDPNGFGGRPEAVGRDGTAPVAAVEVAAPDERGAGLMEMMEAVAAGREPRCSGALALHVVEVMERALDSAAGGRRLAVESRPGRPEPFGGLAG